ncbi:MAG: hypothetical protein DRJ42_12835 [Deltaproteobacteria bacterium]|nr:MAG: hypothetical protein DRJ42_12835 [Deltaproteobacteria bacterium]
MRIVHHVFAFSLIALLSLSAAGCMTGPDGDVGSRAEGLAQPGPWRIPASTVAIGDTQTATLTEAGPWVGPSGCSGGYTEGATELAAYLRANFAGVSRTEGYACRAIVGIADQMSVHGTGRAIDIFIPTIGTEADNDLGDAVGNWLIEHAEEVGIQRVIWDRWTWWSQVPPGYSRSMPYDWEGSHPHNDHLHVEMTVAGGNRATAFFDGPMAPPTTPGCDVLPAAGGTIDDTDLCFQAFGNPDFWRVVSGSGYGGSSIWTNAWQSDAPSNWARWDVRAGAAGDYELAVNTVADFAVYDNVRYDVRHGGATSTVYLDQSAGSGWRSLGVFHFTGESGEGVSVYDNYGVSVAADQHVSVDALRVTWAGTAPPPDAGAMPPPPADSGTPPGPDTDAGGPVVGDDGGVIVGDDGGMMVAADGGVADPPGTRARGGCAIAPPGTGNTPLTALVFTVLAAFAAAARRRRR